MPIKCQQLSVGGCLSVDQDAAYRSIKGIHSHLPVSADVFSVQDQPPQALYLPCSPA